MSSRREEVTAMSKPPVKGPGGRGPMGPRPKVKKGTLTRVLKLLFSSIAF